MGHIFEETVYYFSVKQVLDDEISSDRNLYTNYISLEHRTIINRYNAIIKYFNIKKKILEFNYRLYFYMFKIFGYKKFKNFDEYSFSIKCKYRYKTKRYDNAIRFLKSLAIVKLDVILYDHINDVGSKELGLSKKLYLPLRETIGNYDTHEYRFVQHLLNKISNTIYSKENNYFKNEKEEIDMVKFIFEHDKE